MCCTLLSILLRRLSCTRERFCLLGMLFLSGPNTFSRRSSRPWIRPPTSSKFTDCPKISTVRLSMAERGTKESDDQIKLLSKLAPMLSSSEKVESSMLRENFLLSRSNCFWSWIFSRIALTDIFVGEAVSWRLAKCVQMKDPTWLISSDSRTIWIRRNVCSSAHRIVARYAFMRISESNSRFSSKVSMLSFCTIHTQ